MIRLIKLCLLSLIVFSNVYSQPLSGKKTIGTGGTYATLSAAVSALITNGISGSVDFQILDGSYSETVTITSVAGTSSINPVTFTSKNSNKDLVTVTGGIVLNGASYITFQNLTIEPTGTSVYGIEIKGASTDITINNCRFAPDKGTQVNTGIRQTANSSKVTISNCVFENLGFGFFNSGNQIGNGTLSITNSDFNDCFIGIEASKHTYSYISDNLITGNSSSGIQLTYTVPYIERNNLTLNGSQNNVGIYIENLSTFVSDSGYVANNMISIQNSTQSVNYGIRIGKSSQFCQVVFNTIYMKNNSLGYGLQIIWIGPANVPQDIEIKNNIIATDDQLAITFNYNPSAFNFDIDYNSIYGFSTLSYGMHNVGNLSMSEVQTNFGYQIHGTEATAEFVSNTDLHLTGTSIGNQHFVGTSLEGFTADFDGDTRFSVPYMGADEIVGSSLPVEMTSLNYSVTEKGIVINWSTKTETNNYGWEIESRGTGNKDEGTWRKIGFVKGSGTTTNSKSYSFEFSKSNKLIDVRLKQIDTDGKFSYSNTLLIEAEPETFELLNNYPNPFNPSTEINYHLSQSGTVELKVFDLLGREVKTLVNEEKPAGKYSVRLDASGFSSGVYIYQLRSGNQIVSKKMILSK